MKLVLLSGAHSHTVGYLRTIKEDPDMELVAVWDDFASRGQGIADDMGCPFVPDLDAAIATGDPDASVVCADNANHRDLVEASVKAGLDVFCEKPMALSIEDADAMVSAVRGAGRVMVLGYMQPYTGAMVTVRKLLADGAIGLAVGAALAVGLLLGLAIFNQVKRTFRVSAENFPQILTKYFLIVSCHSNSWR